MRIRVLGAHGGSSPRHRQTSFLVNDALCVDAGAVTEALSLDEQARIRAVLVTHSHMDHVASLPFLVENVFGRPRAPLEVLAPEDVLCSLRAHLFNDALWPDFSRIEGDNGPSVAFRAVPVGAPFSVDGVLATAVGVSHVVPTYGYLLAEERASVLFSGDTGPTEEIWSVARRTPSLRALFVECSFPNDLQRIADASRHLTPASLRAEMEKFPANVPIYLYHMKPPALARLTAEIAALGDPRLRVLVDGDDLTF
ncbi:MAG TPA: 3',5'-cyclic-nucleotide phosphodiesterase [Thermoanaerobaculia bacterium]|nr:3',5'-cyclic-nucleotide phosphodiesterase [Thermoanaerobaculia bacterium]